MPAYLAPSSNAAKPIDQMSSAEVEREIAERLFPPESRGHGWIHVDCSVEEHWIPRRFCSDLNAAHEAWMRLTDAQKIRCVIAAGRGWADCFCWGLCVALDADAATISRWIVAALRTES